MQGIGNRGEALEKDPNHPHLASKCAPLQDTDVSKADVRSLPPSSTKRWVVRRKAQVVKAVRSGNLSLEEACERYHLSEAEFRAWEISLERHGIEGLRVTRLQNYREP